MAIRKSAPAAKTNDRPQADGFLNLSITDKHGNVHIVKAVVPLYLTDTVHAAIMGKSEVMVKGSVHIVDKNPKAVEL